MIAWGDELDIELISGWLWVLRDEQGAYTGGLLPGDVTEGVAGLVLSKGEVVEAGAPAVE